MITSNIKMFLNSNTIQILLQLIRQVDGKKEIIRHLRKIRNITIYL